MSILIRPTHRTHRTGKQTGQTLCLLALVSALALLLAAVGCSGQTIVQTPVTSGATFAPTVALMGIDMVDEQTGWAISEASVFRTIDGGKSWMNVTPKVDDLAASPFAWPNGVNFFDSQVARLAMSQSPGKIIISALSTEAKTGRT